MKTTTVVCVLLMINGSFLFAQKYMGVDNPAQNPNCSSSFCHESEFSFWEQSGHSKAHPAQSSFYGYDCLQCHTTGWDLNNDNLGADEFVIKDPTQSPDYIILPENVIDWNARVNVQCEACHGPVGSDEGILDWNHIKKITDYSAENCGKCHEGAHHPYYSEWSQSAHASGNPVYMNLKNREQYSSCMYCHFAQDFIEFTRNPNYDAATFQPEGELVDITCVTCHDSHTGRIRELSGEFAGKSICDVCHTVHEEEIDFNDTPHHTTSEVLSSSSKFGWQYEGEDYSQATSFHRLIRERCVACHVHPTEYSSTTGLAVTGHTFKPRVEACAEACHTDYYSSVDTSDHEKRFDFRGVQTEIKGLWNELGGLLENASSSDSATTRFKKALYNYRAVESEGSWGIHNTGLVRKLLQDAIGRMNLTKTESTNDLPTDFILNQNYPNPFNPSTVISFSLPEISEVKLIIYDALGKEINSLINETLSRGSYETLWNSNGLPSGVYFYKLETPKFVKVRKMLLVK